MLGNIHFKFERWISQKKQSIANINCYNLWHMHFKKEMREYSGVYPGGKGGKRDNKVGLGTKYQRSPYYQGTLLWNNLLQNNLWIQSKNSKNLLVKDIQNMLIYYDIECIVILYYPCLPMKCGNWLYRLIRVRIGLLA